jgi:transcription elongation factor SPT6
LEEKAQQAVYKRRFFSDPDFKNIGYQMALEYLSMMRNGAFIFRPSSSDSGSINLTWKIYDKLFFHLVIKEKNSLVKGQTCFLFNNIEYSDLNAIKENYISKCNRIIEGALSHEKFLKEEIDVVKERLKTEKQNNPNRIIYGFSITDRKPEYVVLTLVVDKGEIIYELIKVKPEGLIFH